VAAAVELDDQLRDRGVERATIVVAAGTGGTLAGLLAGLRLLGSEHDVLGIDVGRLWRAFPASIASLASATCALLGRPWRVSAGEIPIVEGTYAGQGYARDTPAARAAARLVREADGIELDPVYTAKAMAGLVDLVASGKWPEAEHVVFLHTGGVTAEPGARRGASRDR
jgi:1-aminocyclopropane-1-carboxylate deaminase/D-cysteine desulfhydrase-like pyridoxal-dependent ACC family enzyme